MNAMNIITNETYAYYIFDRRNVPGYLRSTA